MGSRPIARAPSCRVERVVECSGPRGGTIHVLVLACGAWLTRRLKDGKPPPESAPCIACFLKAQLKDASGV